MDRDDIVGRIRSISKVNTLNVTDADLVLMVNEGVLAVAAAHRWPFLVDTASIGVTAAQETYTFSSLSITDFEMAWMMYGTAEDQLLVPITYQQRMTRWADDPPTATEGEYFYISEDSLSIGIVPVPSATEASAYTLVYYKTATVMATGGALPEWNAAFHDVLVDYVLAILYEREEFYDQSEAARQKFDVKLSKMKRFYKALRVPENSPMIYGGGAFGLEDPWANWPKGLKWGY